YAEANVVVSGTWVYKNRLALRMLRGGVMIIDPHTGSRDQITDYATGLPDYEDLSLMADVIHNIRAAHESGFTQISPSLPFRSYSYYSGLRGNMLGVHAYRNNVDVGTSLGLFKLEKEEVYDEIVTYVEIDAAPGSAKPQVQDETPSRRK